MDGLLEKQTQHWQLFTNTSVIPPTLQVTMTLLILKSNYLNKCEDFSYFHIILNELSWLCFQHSKRRQLYRVQWLLLLKITQYHKKSSLSNIGQMQLIYFLLMPIYICPNIGAQSLHTYVLIYTCIITNLWEPAFVHDFMRVLLKVKHVLLTD